MKRMVVAPRAIALAFLLSAPGRAGAVDKEVETRALKFSKTVLPMATYEDKLDRMVKAIYEAQPPLKKKQLSQDFWKKLRVEIEKLLPYDEMVKDGATEYAKHYSADDLKRLLAFYQSPLGQKALKVMPQVMADSSALVEKHLGERLQPVLVELMKSEPAASAPAASQQ
jgi:hypothetical protein